MVASSSLGLISYATFTVFLTSCSITNSVSHKTTKKDTFYMAFMSLIMFSSLSNISHFSVNLKIQTLNIQTLQIFDNVFVHCIKFELPHKFLVVLLL